jgi:hypothetical protein
MELPRLASKQKRYRDILHFAQTEVTDPRLQQELLRTLSKYRLTLATCWSKQTFTDQDQSTIASLERTLETIHNEARLRTASM